MTSLQILIMVCPMMAASPNDCFFGTEKTHTTYKELETCKAQAVKIYDESVADLLNAGALLRVGCVDKEYFQTMELNKEKGKFI